MNPDQGYFTPPTEIWSTNTRLEDNAGVSNNRHRAEDPRAIYWDERTYWHMIASLTKMNTLSWISIPNLASPRETQSPSNLDEAFSVLGIPFYRRVSPDTCYKARYHYPIPNLLNQCQHRECNMNRECEVTICHGFKTFSYLYFSFVILLLFTQV